MVVYTTEDMEFLDACRYYYFGRAFEIVSSKKMKLETKRVALKALLDELHVDRFLENPALKLERDSMISLLFEKLKSIEFAIKVKENKKNIRYSFSQGELAKAVKNLFKKKR